MQVKVKRGTKSQLDAAAAAGALELGEPYLITDQERIAVGLGRSSYSSMAKQSEVRNDVISGIPVQLSSPQANDVLSFTGTVFTNRANYELTDGGNF